MEIKIIDFEPKFTNEVKDLIFTTLKKVGIEPSKINNGTDEDLDHIPEIYKDRGHFWLAIVAGKLAGVVAVKPVSQEEARLKRLFVLHEFHGTGVGQELLNTALNFARVNGYKNITLGSSRIMTRSHRFYEKNGFKRTGEKEDKLQYKLIL